jgi:TPP-dependent pyruvate/acetoin dehydrogenase alpha subunit
MIHWSSDKLVKFEEGIASLFNSGEIKFPIHLSNGNEENLIEIFKEVQPQDWVIGSWRSHYQCLLKGVPERELKSAILQGKSISLCFPEYRIYSSAIVGGQLPIAVGVAMAIRKKKTDEKVWCFLGDMTSETGIAQSCFRYSLMYNLPITFIIEDNSLSVLTDTRKSWNSVKLRYEESKNTKVISYKYKSKYPHAGAGIRVQF